MDISQKILSDPVNNWVFSHAGTEAYLVGGYIRDLMLGRRPYDKDYVLKKNARRTAKKFAKEFGGTFIELKEELTYRAALRNGQFIDFNNLEKKIEGDLLLRDYTVNAMAWSPDTGIIDPTGGILSIKKRAITAVSPRNLQKDPLRVLRAYRIAAQLNFSIDPQTKAFLKKYSDLITGSAPERITEELFKLLNSDNALNYLFFCVQDGVFKAIFGLTGNKIIKNLHELTLLEKFIKKTSKNHKLEQEISQGLNRLGLIRLSFLLKNADKSHELGYIRPSNMIRQKIREILKAQELCKGRMTDKRLYEIFRTAGGSVYETALILSSMRPRRRDRERFIHRAYDYEKIKAKHLINGHEIKEILKIQEGAEIGRIQEKIKYAQFKEFFKNKSQAVKWIISNFT